ncbi:MAG TPA: hypothetical protein VJM32_03540 [Candidatus Saccharimonadales bacterium]|nr:hypothetical protein [Candidatus Saccharimonadales bacterium]
MSALTVDGGRIVTYGVFVDGCPSAVVQPHVHAAASQVGMTVGPMMAGSSSPFFTAVGRPSLSTNDALVAFAQALAQQEIVGPYCDEAGQTKIIKHDTLVRAVVAGRIGNEFTVDAIATTDKQLAAGLGARTVEGKCPRIVLDDSRTTARLTVYAADVAVLSRRLRLMATVASLRWDKQDAATAELLGEPLV